MDLTTISVVVTGAASGLGATTVAALAERGVDVVGHEKHHPLWKGR